ncbi:hypothetical protein JOB18_022363 [Solea senegalensis]|uniref:C-type lectin domain-containing protein n=3 Tax=Solea senegalensis TaxID=28829 RepID=A0AAV6SME0_SOLSE|nr:hypothetical protein JOB18_022363 [Solea senegalensis]
MTLNSLNTHRPDRFLHPVTVLIIFIMKVLLFLTVLLCGVLAITAAAVEAVKPEEAPVEPQEEKQAVEVEVEAVPEAVPLEGEPQPAGEVAAPVQGRFICPSGWVGYKDGCFLFVTAGRSWNSAAGYCNSLGASLPSVKNVFDYSFLQDLTMRSGQSVSWMGGFYFQTWMWLDQSPFSYSNFASVNTVSRYQCMYLQTRAGWSNHSCGNAWPFICVKKTGSC